MFRYRRRNVMRIPPSRPAMYSKNRTSSPSQENSPRKQVVEKWMRLCKIAAPDTIGPGATDLAVGGVGENLGVASLAFVLPSLGCVFADVAETGELWHLAEPATEVACLEAREAVLTRGKYLTEGAGVELVNHLAVAALDSVQSVVLELNVKLKGRKTHL